MKLGRLNHIGVATPSIADSIVFYRDVMGATKIHEPFDLPDQGVKVCFVDTPGAGGALDGTQIELIEPYGENSPIHAFLAKNPAGGQHHVCFEVADIHAAKADMEAEGAKVLGEPRIGAHAGDLRPSPRHGRRTGRTDGNTEGRRALSAYEMIRVDIADAVANVVRGRMNKQEAVSYVRRYAEKQVVESDRERFIEVVETQLISLHEGNIARYQLRSAEFRSWQAVWE